MANTKLKITQIMEDIKNSWYFRFWLLFWIPCGLMAFVALIILGNISRQNQHHEDTKIWWENASEVYYPRFHFRLPENEGSIAGVNCVYDGTQTLSHSTCQSWRGLNMDISQCVALDSQGFGVQNSMKDSPWQETIQCNVTAVSPTNTSLLLAWEIEDYSTNADVGGNSYASIWIAPTTNAHVGLSKSVTTFDHKPLNLWFRNLVYHSTVSEYGTYTVTIEMMSFGIFHYDKMNMYNPWRAVGDIGGFAFFVTLLHIAMMLIVGVCLSNTSTFLSQSSAVAVSGSIHDNTGTYTKM